MRNDPREWQLISTAPKDESVILATNGTVLGGFPQVVHWLDGRWHVDDANISYHPDFFTHWMRIPTSPAVARYNGQQPIEEKGKRT